MITKKMDIWVFGILLLCLFVQMGYFYPKLPAQVAMHFNGAGEPDHWGSKNKMLVFQLGLYIFMGSLFYGSRFLVSVLPDSMVNLPKKEYWLSPERRDETMRFIQSFTVWIGNATFLLFLFLFQLNFQACLTDHPLLNMKLFIPIFLGYMVFILLWTTRFMIKFIR